METVTEEFALMSDLDRSVPHRPREEGDGAPLSGRHGDSTPTAISPSKPRPFSVHFECDLMQILLFVLALATRTWQLGIPRAVVFDELHYAKFVSLYMKNIFFYDVHPPLGKLLLAVVGHYVGFEGDVNFDRIGAEFAPSVPVYQLRLLPAFLGSLLVPVIYQVTVELGLSRWAGLLAGAFIVFDNALLVQSRFMLMEGMLLCFQAFSLLCLLKFRNLSDRQFSLRWWVWLCLTGVSFTFTLSVKYVGAFTALLVLYIISKDYWKMLADTSKTDMCLIKHLCSRVFFLVTVPVSIYLFIFYIHLSLLTKAGPHDNIMTSAFQASLEGGLAAITKGQPLHVAYGSQITLRQTYDIANRPCWLHSHSHLYPIRYPDNRGSSHQQQVTCYIFKDIHNWWIIKDPNSPSMLIDEPPRPVKHGDVVQLVHGITSRALNSHDVAAPVSPQNQEVSCYIDYNVSMPVQNLWKVEIINRDHDDDTWQTIKSHIRLIHVNTSQAIRVTGKQLPDWGFHQLEVATDRVISQPATTWNVEEHRYTKSVGDEEQMRELSQAEMIPLEPTHLSFWDKFWELQIKMLISSQDSEMEHKYRSEPLEWPLLDKTIAYWLSPNSNAQIHLLGNPVIWYASTLSVAAYSALFLFYIMRRRREVFDLTEAEWEHFVLVGEMLVGGYLLHFLPHFGVNRTLFLHHYLPAVIFKILLLAAVIDHLHRVAPRFLFATSLLKYVTVALFSLAVWSFWQLSVFSYGNVPLSAEEIERLTWKESWEFIVHQRPH